MKTAVFLSTIVFLISAAICSADQGEYTFDDLSYSVSARALGLGNALSCYADDASAPFWNPAELSSISKYSLSTAYSDLFGSFRAGLVKYNFIAYAQRIEGIGTVGLGWMRVGVEDIPITGEDFIDVNGNGKKGDFQDKNGNGVKDPGEMYIDLPIISGSFDSHDDVILISYGIGVTSRLSAGISLKLLQQKIYTNMSTGWGVDLGLSHRLWSRDGDKVSGEMRLAFVLRDLGTHVRWDTSSRASFSRPLSYTLGVAGRMGIRPFVSLLLNVDYRSDEREIWVGTELSILRVLSLRCGLYRKRPTFGAGFRIPLKTTSIRVDYAFTSHDELGRSQMVAASLGM
ncbi:PorV/PorQ family protein [Candidatus Poribacteria bacterium]|nr:PorV/PorQ family protein [Candidatus Poribacteria bacterium]